METKPYICSFLFITLLFLFATLNLSLSPPQQLCHPDDQRALLEIKAYSIWTPLTDCCRSNKWLGVLCKKIPKTQIHRVNFLKIIGSDEVVGTIPSTLEKLPYLETLILRLLPNLTSPIPPVIGKLTKLKYLSLNWTGLSGLIPHFFSRLTNLTILNLNDNCLCGPILTELQHFDVSTFEHNSCLCGAPLLPCK